VHCLFASKSLGPQAQLLAQMGEAIGVGIQPEAFRDVERFSERLRRHNGPGILILLASDRWDLARLGEDREILLPADIILLVPNHAADTIATAHSLRPRYLGTTDCDLDEVVPVLQQLLRKRASRSEEEPGPTS
jgi:hypothetical protein